MKKLWTNPEEQNSSPSKNPASHVNRKPMRDEHLDEIFDDKTLHASASRRDFLKLFGFSLASAAVAASCEQPIRKAIPYLIRPEEITPGVANYYASTFFDGNDYCSILVKVRDGRPIKIEGNELSPVTQGGTSARVQASVLSLYDDARYKHPSNKGSEISWEKIDAEITGKLTELANEEKEIVLLSSTIISPATLKTIELLKAKYSSLNHIQYDSVSASGMLTANQQSFGKAVIPSYNFDKAELIVSFGADFLGNWLSPVEFTKQYSRSKSLTNGEKNLSKHIQLEANLSLTGSNADERIPIKPSQEKLILANLYNEIAKSTGETLHTCTASPVDISPIALQLLKHRTKSLVVSGSNDKDIQLIVNAINDALGNYGNTIDLNNPLLSRKGKDEEVAGFIERLDSEEIGGVIFYDTNPLYDHPEAQKIQKGLEKCELSVAIGSQLNETAEAATYICPDHHYLESWNDAEIKPGNYSLTQPTIAPIFNTRQAAETFLLWAGNESSYHEFLKESWQKNQFRQSSSTDFFKFWNSCLHDGVLEIPKPNNAGTVQINETNIASAFGNYPAQTDSIELVLYEKVGIGSGKHANNPWLQEMPDPVSKATWDNYLCVASKDAESKGLKLGDLVSLNDIITLPVIVQPGQAIGTVSAALGYGRTIAGKVANGVGQNLAGFINMNADQRLYSTILSKLEKTGEGYALAQTQTHHSMEGRPLIRQASLSEYLQNPAAGNEKHEEIKKLHTTLYKEHEYKGHHWGMAIDLNKCTGCSACLIACSAENNVPVVGKKEVVRAHEMHWIRIDRYYEGDPDNPKTYRQPVTCQHCDNAPCENVCPVAATNHSDEGINQMAYNRCIGTRYCNNNCPYKVRRFNWFDYTTADALKGNTYDPAGMTLDLKRMVLNPDVTVRSKGVIEKCSFCVQRIQEKKLTAKLEDRALLDGDIKSACQQACPAEAIVFGDTNDPNSKVSKMFADPRNYNLLEELHTLPSVGYLTKITNTEEA